MLHFPGNALAYSLENFLGEVRQACDQPLRMPIHLRWGGGLGSAVHSLQVVASWADSGNSNLTLLLPESFGSQASTRERFSSTLQGMAALYFADSIRCDGTSFSRYKALQVVAPRVAAMQSEAFRDTLRGPGVALCCFAGAKSEFLGPLYARPEHGAVRDISDFRILLPRMLQHVGDRASASLEEGKFDYISGLLHQLFLNADEHGSSDAMGEPYERAIRGIVLRLTTIGNIGQLVRLAGDDAALRTYLSRLVLLPPNRTSSQDERQKFPSGPMQLLELSVFDTGPGLALRWLAEKIGRKSYSEIPQQEEEEAVKTCFKKHATTKASQYFGQGLPVALGAMKQLNAFMTLRTGRLSLYQDFSRQDGLEFKPKKRFAKVDSLPVIAGTGYTVYFRVK